MILEKNATAGQKREIEIIDLYQKNKPQSKENELIKPLEQLRDEETKSLEIEGFFNPRTQIHRVKTLGTVFGISKALHSYPLESITHLDLSDNGLLFGRINFLRNMLPHLFLLNLKKNYIQHISAANMRATAQKIIIVNLEDNPIKSLCELPIEDVSSNEKTKSGASVIILSKDVLTQLGKKYSLTNLDTGFDYSPDGHTYFYCSQIEIAPNNVTLFSSQTTPRLSAYTYTPSAGHLLCGSLSNAGLYAMLGKLAFKGNRFEVKYVTSMNNKLYHLNGSLIAQLYPKLFSIILSHSKIEKIYLSDIGPLFYCKHIYLHDNPANEIIINPYISTNPPQTSLIDFSPETLSIKSTALIENLLQKGKKSP